MGIEHIYTPINSFKMLQHLINICNLSYEGESWKEVDTMLWVLGKIDMKKLIDRVWDAMDHPEKQTKVVLCEYNYTTKHSVEAGHPNVVDRLHNGVLVHDAMYRQGFIDLMFKTFCINENVTWYRRRKITREGVSDVHRMQVVLVFKEHAFVPPPTEEEESATPVCRSCEGYHWTLSCPDRPVSVVENHEDPPASPVEVSDILREINDHPGDCYCHYESETAADVL